jgi:hypothetical protein
MPLAGAVTDKVKMTEKRRNMIEELGCISASDLAMRFAIFLVAKFLLR